MSLKGASVLLIMKLEGAIAIPGSYEYKEKTTSGSILPEEQRLFTIREVQDCECTKKTVLGEKFVNFAISDEGRPERREHSFKSFKAHTFWRKMSDIQKLNYHVAKYAADMGATNYTFLINGEE